MNKPFVPLAPVSRTQDPDQIDIAKWMQDFIPLDVYYYFDRIRIYMKGQISDAWLEALKRECGSVQPLGPAWFNEWYQKLEIYQPTPTALLQLSTLPDNAYVSYVEVASDVITPDALSLGIVSKAFLDGFLQPYHRNKRARVFIDESGCVTGFSTRRSPEEGERRRGFWFQWYVDRPCKLTGEPFCFHFEGKHEGSQAVRRLGFRHPRDLANFDFRAYSEKHASTLYKVDYERLGRFHDNRQNGKRRKTASSEKWSSDIRTGHILYKALSQDLENKASSLQQFVDTYGKGPFLERYNITMFIGTNTLMSSQTNTRTPSKILEEA
jgi:hypothetical protein